MSQERACAVAVRLLDLGYVRIGNDVYAEQNGSFGLTTLQRRLRGGSTIASAVRRRAATPGEQQSVLERAVLRLLSEA
jgi:DNA topoisomerase IB